MRRLRFGHAAAVLTVFTVACGSSPTAPSASTSPIAHEETGLTGTSSAATQAPGAPRGVCAIEAIELRTAPSTYRNAQSVAAIFKGDPTYCSALTWSTVPAARLVESGKNGSVVTLFDDPANRRGVVDVTATVLVETSRLSETIRVSFPRGGKS
jgi:hypothetical protein